MQSSFHTSSAAFSASTTGTSFGGGSLWASADAVGSKVSVKPAEAFSAEAWSEIQAAMTQTMSKKKEVHKREIHRREGHTSPTSPYRVVEAEMPMMQMAMVPMPMPIPQQQQTEVEVDETVTIDETMNIMTEKMKHLWEAKIAERDFMWQREIQELQARVSVLSMHVSSNDPVLQSENAGLREQIRTLEENLLKFHQEESRSVRAIAEYEAKIASFQASIETKEVLIFRLEEDLKRRNSEVRELNVKIDEERKERLALYDSVANSKEQAVITESISIELQTKCQAIAELERVKIALEAELEGAQVHIQRLQGIVSLLQVKIAERDDIRVKAAFDVSTVSIEQKKVEVFQEEEVRERVTREIEERFEAKTLVYEEMISTKKRELETLQLRLEEESVRHQKELQIQLEIERAQWQAQIHEIKKSYEYLDKCIMVDPQNYSSSHSALSAAYAMKQSTRIQDVTKVSSSMSSTGYHVTTSVTSSEQVEPKTILVESADA